MNFTLVSRGGWGARPPRHAVATSADETFQHHTAGVHRGAADVRAIQNFHMDIRGWSDIAYNFLIDRFTNVVYEGRGWGVRPGSQRSYNTGTWSVCLMGDFRSAVPTKANLATVAALIRHGENLGHIPRVLTGGHKDAPGQATTCPGPNLYARLPAIRDILEADDMTRDEILAELGITLAELGRLRQLNTAAEAERPITIEGAMTRLFQYEKANDFPGSGSGDHDHDGRYLKGVNGIK